jgi:hypothetical protein
MFQNIDGIVDLLVVKGNTLWDKVPFFQAFPTTGSRCMLGGKNRVISHGRLFAVIFQLGWRKTGFDKIAAMLENYIQTFGIEIGGIFGRKFKATTEF